VLLETIRLALTSIRRNLLRSILTLLGVTIGVAAVIAMVTLGQGTSIRITSSISSLGSNMLIVTPGRLEDGGYGSSSFRIADADAIERQVDGIKSVSPIGSRTLTAVFGATNHLTTLNGADNRFFETTNWAIAEGRAFREGELVSGATVCVLGHEVATKLFGTADPLDQIVRLKKVACRVIGVLEQKGAGMFGGNQDDIIVMPLRTFQRRIAGNSDVVVMYVSAEDEDDIAKVQQDITDLLRERRHLSAIESDDFSVTDMRQITSMLSTVTGVLTGLLAAVAGISLLVGGIGIMNIMLVSVTERTQEIGVRLAIGARESQVLGQFLTEAVILSMIGGAAGIVLGLGLAAGGGALLDVPFVIDLPSILGAFAFSAIVGVGFGYFPARNAARLDPIEALRHS
jgi:putative ABC transport system permease protein